MTKFQGPGLYDLNNGRTMFCDESMIPGAIALRESAGEPAKMDIAEEEFEKIAVRHVGPVAA